MARNRANKIIDGKKLCQQCNVILDLTCFKEYSGRKKYSRFCEDCLFIKKRETQKKSDVKHKDKRLANSRRWREANKEYHNELCKQWKANNPLRGIIKDIKKRAKGKGLEFTITYKDIFIPEFCPVLGIPLFKGPGIQTPNSPSVDRIDSTKGYTKDNIQVISTKANTIKSNATLEELILVGNWAQRELDKRIE